MEKIGVDVHKVSTQVCILTEDGEYEESRIRTDRDALTMIFGERPKARIVLAASTESEWVARHLESMGHEVIVADPNFAPMCASRSRKVKTDKRDARTLCQACHLGAYRLAHRCSDDSRLLRKHLRAREAFGADTLSNDLRVPLVFAPRRHPNAERWRAKLRASRARTSASAGSARG